LGGDATNTNSGRGHFVTGTFTANATTQDFLFTDTSPTQSTTLLNAFQLRAIPEPSAALLGGLGMLALLRRRRA
jgi:hypothetical protein